MSFGKPKAPKPTEAQKQLEASQVLQLTKLDAQENERRKRLLSAAQGVRAYRGSPVFRSSPSDTAGSAGSAGPSGAGGYNGLIPSGIYGYGGGGLVR
jgi:hypothetical protein